MQLYPMVNIEVIGPMSVRPSQIFFFRARRGHTTKQIKVPQPMLKNLGSHKDRGSQWLRPPLVRGHSTISAMSANFHKN